MRAPSWLHARGVAHQALEVLRKLRSEKAGEVKEFKLRLAHLATHRDAAARLRREGEGGRARAAELAAQIGALDQEAAALTQVRVWRLQPLKPKALKRPPVAYSHIFLKTIVLHAAARGQGRPRARRRAGRADRRA